MFAGRLRHKTHTCFVRRHDANRRPRTDSHFLFSTWLQLSPSQRRRRRICVKLSRRPLICAIGSPHFRPLYPVEYFSYSNSFATAHECPRPFRRAAEIRRRPAAEWHAHASQLHADAGSIGVPNKRAAWNVDRRFMTATFTTSCLRPLMSKFRYRVRPLRRPSNKPGDCRDRTGRARVISHSICLPAPTKY